jgi:hypothetical protein
MAVRRMDILVVIMTKKRIPQIIAAHMAVLVVDQIPVIIRNVQLYLPVAGIDLGYCVSFIPDSFQAKSQKL